MNLLILSLLLISPVHRFVIEHNGHVLDDGAIFDQVYQEASAAYDAGHGTSSATALDGLFITIQSTHFYAPGPGTMSCLHAVRWGAVASSQQNSQAAGVAGVIHPRFTSDSDTLRPILRAVFDQLLSEHYGNSFFVVNLDNNCVGQPEDGVRVYPIRPQVN